MAESFPIGTGEIGPAPGERTGVQVAASRDGYLAVWIDDRGGDGWGSPVYGRRLDSSGVPVGAESVRLSGPVYASTLVVASDGDDYLVVFAGPYGMSAMPVRDGVASAPRLLPLDGPPAAIGWNGRHYFLVASAATLARHAPDGTFRDKLLVGDDVRDSAVAADGTHAAIVLATRGADQMTTIEASRWELLP